MILIYSAVAANDETSPVAQGCEDEVNSPAGAKNRRLNNRNVKRKDAPHPLEVHPKDQTNQGQDALCNRCCAESGRGP